MAVTPAFWRRSRKASRSRLEWPTERSDRAVNASSQAERFAMCDPSRQSLLDAAILGILLPGRRYDPKTFRKTMRAALSILAKLSTFERVLRTMRVKGLEPGRRLAKHLFAAV